MPTYGKLRMEIFKEAGVNSFVAFNNLSPAHRKFHDKVIHYEFMEGYPNIGIDRDDQDLSCLELLTEEAYEKWLNEFRKINRRKKGGFCGNQIYG